jgi:hypothetical protein
MALALSAVSLAGSAETLTCGFNLSIAAFALSTLARPISAQRDFVVVENADLADARRREILNERRSETARTYDRLGIVSKLREGAGGRIVSKPSSPMNAVPRTPGKEHGLFSLSSRYQGKEFPGGCGAPWGSP